MTPPGRWPCPACGREFRRSKQSHTCLPGCTADDTFRAYPLSHRAIYDAIVAHLETLGPVHIDAVQVGVFLKRTHKLAEIRPRARSVQLALVLPHTIEHPRIGRHSRSSPERIWHPVPLATVADFDADVRAWLTEAYFAAE